MGLKINQKQSLEDSERRGVLADYMNNRQRSGIISSKVKMTNRFMDMDFLGGKEPQGVEQKVEKVQAKPVVSKAPRQSVLNTMAIIKAVEKVEKKESKGKDISSDDSLKEISGSSSENDENFMEDAMDDLDALEKEL
jgi:hypothetical protein